jgi:cytochrome c oxidase subunit 4
MKNGDTHISSFTSHAIVLIVLLTLTFVSVSVTSYNLGAFSVTIALAIASVKVATVIANFMHVKHEGLFIKLMISGVFVLYALVIIITFIDYHLR